MSDAVPYLVLAGCLAVVAGSLTWLKDVLRRRGTAGSAVRGALASYEEAMRITSHDSHHEIRAQADRRAPVLSPGEPKWTGRGAADGVTTPERPVRRRGLRRPRRRSRRRR